ncbi:MFS transporter [Dactylosporangium roseum]|uniref:MFS transporter n=1 Tax=Dactylosporangium roseum TaxID=47989 RepID=A0ABY5Z8A0_9ACTN|nr:MFS transporter [Dactylosporangium roseum]UWZ38289.1 MFS transporter [Dactylosporangium roseum]
MTGVTALITPPGIDVHRLQRRTLGLLVGMQVIGGLGVASGVSVGALLAASMAGPTAAGLAGSSAVIGAALVAVPAARLMRSGGRRPGLVFAYAVGALGALLVAVAAGLDNVPLLFLGMFLFGGSSAANLQSRYAAVDLAAADRRARHLSIVVWATTIGAVAGPNLAPLTDRLTARWGVPEYGGPYLFSAVVFGSAAVAMLAFLRPDPLMTARSLAAKSNISDKPRGMWREAVRTVLAGPDARVGVAAVAVGHVVMVGVMSMTPVHIGDHVHDHGDLLRVVGLVISIHITGMYALSPVIGWLADRYGRRPLILAGVALLLLACALSGTAGGSMPRLSVGMALLGVGWGCMMVAGSTLLSESVPVEQRAGVQGLSDLVMGVSGASAGALAGVVVDLFGYPALTIVAAVAVVPLVAVVSRRRDTTAHRRTL